jgi:hypothetical protein
MKLRKTTTILIFTLIFGGVLAACGVSATPTAQSNPKLQAAAPVGLAKSEKPAAVLNSMPESGSPLWVEQVPRVDEQGAVTVEIVPLNLNNYGHTLDFLVSLNTHSVDLSMDLSELAILTTDTGHKVPALSWDAPSGGHHVRGTLSFPATVDATPVLDGVAQFSLTLVDVDAPERTFTWSR